MAKDTGDNKDAEDRKTEQNKAAAAKRQSETKAQGQSTTADTENTSFMNTDRFENPDAKGLVAYQTATDGQGIERIVGPAPTAWSPAPLEATDEQKAEAAKRDEAFQAASKQRLEALSGDIKDEDRAQNVQGDGGSQDTPAL